MSHLNLSAEILQRGGLHATQTARILRVEIVRDKALNALIPETFHALHHILDLTSANPPFHILIRGRGRAFSAGGDVRALRAKAVAAGKIGSDARRAAVIETLKTEYDFLERWEAMRGSGVVTVGCGDGLAFGAGAGLFQACAVRLVTPKFMLAMPEVKIGLIPDCGATRFFARMPGCTGMFAALTGWRIAAGDALALGLADGGVTEGWWGEGLEGGGGGEEAVFKCVKRDVVKGLETALADGGSEMRRGIDACFSKANMEEVVETVERAAGNGVEWAMEALGMLREASPRALRQTFVAMREGYRLAGEESLRKALDRELEADGRLGSEWDFEEGVRAALIDKDKKPLWKR